MAGKRTLQKQIITFLGIASSVRSRGEIKSKVAPIVTIAERQE